MCVIKKWWSQKRRTGFFFGDKNKYMTFPYTNRLARGMCESPLTVPKRNSLFLFSSVIVVTIETVNGSLGSLKQ